MDTNKKSIKRKHSDNDESDEEIINNYVSKSSIGLQILKKMKFEGGGLGKYGQGETKDIEVENPMGRKGLGHHIRSRIEINFNELEEVKTIEEHPKWCPSCENGEEIVDIIEDSWLVYGKPKEIIEDETKFCSGETLQKMIDGKNVFDHLSDKEINYARTRANPYETVKGGFFQNRAAMKMANLDKIYDWLLSGDVSREDRLNKNPLDIKVDELYRKNTDRDKPLFYFADVCAGPGGFTEYILWRKGFYNAKGFGFTLIGDCDFNLSNFTAASPMYFHPYYGKERDGDIMNPENLTSLQEFVISGSYGNLCDLVMCDGGFSVAGKENIQEILSKRLYLCQFIAGLSLGRQSSDNRVGGNFVCKLFDLFTPFSIGLVYLMYLAYEKISLHKCHTSRPANSERYIVCKNLRPWGGTIIKDYLMKINKKLDEIEKKGLTNERDILEIVPESLLFEDGKFIDYIVDHNESVAQRQTYYLSKYAMYAKNSSQRDKDQGKIRNECLQYWEIPDRPKIFLNNSNNRNRQNNYTSDECEYMTKLLHGKTLNPSAIYAEPQLVQEQFFKLEGYEVKRMRAEEIRFNFASTISERGVLMSTRNGIFRIPRSGGFVKIAELNHIIPFDSFVYYEKTPLFKKTNGRMVNVYDSNETFYRIIDAAMISGDYIADQPLEVRIRAIRKMCHSVSKTKGESKRSNDKMSRRERELNERLAIDKNKGYFKKEPPSALDNEDTILGANLYKISDISCITDKIEVHKYNGQYMGFIKEDDKFYIPIGGLRFYNILKKFNQWYYSSSNKNKYLFKSNTRQTFKCEDVVANFRTYFNSFFDLFLLEKDCFANIHYWNLNFNNNVLIDEIFDNDPIGVSIMKLNSVSKFE